MEPDDKESHFKFYIDNYFWLGLKLMITLLLLIMLLKIINHPKLQIHRKPLNFALLSLGLSFINDMLSVILLK
jgi:hypothetical protein